MTAYYRITVEDLETGEKHAVEIAEGDYALVPTGSCFLDGQNWYANGTVQLTIKGHHPAGPKREVPA